MPCGKRSVLSDSDLLAAHAEGMQALAAGDYLDQRELAQAMRALPAPDR